ncbi:MAG: LysM peptidoglycan-binding domain-containing protein [Phycisphaerales bacterium]|nr:MAG: LysM peptidoglycan-binding domain-containing protein [Phycisphaerales bacterium]
MASEAKIGLLLGLVIMFVVAFALNELPRFGDAIINGSPDSAGLDKLPGIGAHVRDHIKTSRPTEPAEKQVVSRSSEESSEVPTSFASLPVIPPIQPELPAGEETGATGHESIKQIVSEVYYTVSEGDNLAEIAKKFYGPLEGNKRANVLRIFLANRKLLASPHQIRAGQKLVIPHLTSSESNGITIGGIFPSWMFEKVESIGMRHLSAEKPKPKKIRQYVVREGDSLWRVAAAQLGDPTRYKEIIRLNADILKNEDMLSVGMRLRLPAQ